MNSIEKAICDIPKYSSQKNSIEDIRRVLDLMGYRDGVLKIIHVAGTNGKGSVCAYLTSVLVDAGYRVGTFISPHLVDMRERIMLDGRPISETDFEDVYTKTKAFVDEIIPQGNGAPTFFEFLFYMSMYYYMNISPRPDYVILETGLGGRLDATNSITPILSVITSIGMDHMQYLGDTIEKIAYEKACIISESHPVVYDARNPISSKVIEEMASEKKAISYAVRSKDEELLEDYLESVQVRYKRFDAALAIKAIEVLGLTHMTYAHMCETIKNTYWPARMQQISKDLFIDGAHNPDATLEFCNSVIDICHIDDKHPILIIAAMKDKDFDSISRIISDKLSVNHIYVCKLDNDRAMSTVQLEDILKQYISNVTITKCVDTASALISAENQKKANEIIFCMGSLYLAGEVLKIKKGKAYD